METVNKYEAVIDLMDFLKVLRPDDLNSVEERKLNAMYEVLHNVRRSAPIISLEVITDFINEIRDVKDLEPLSSHDPDKLDAYFKSVITRRLCHCAINLLSKYQNGTKTPSGEYVMFNDKTHFSKPVYEDMLNALKVRHEEWNPLVWQQVVRQMHSEHSTDDDEFDIATEYLLVATNEPK